MTKIKDIFENSVSGNKYISKKIINPYRDWMILLVVFFIMICFFVLFDILTYHKIIKGEMYVSVLKEELTFIKLEKEKLQAIVDLFKEKEDFISNIKIKKLIDPSI